MISPQPPAMSITTTHLSTDYLIVGAGAMGMSFLEELITATKHISAIIVDIRSSPGGHWNDAYSFVRLHQPALTYGLNSRSLGAGGPDLASKAVILQHYELAMKDLVATGRVKFFPQCRYLGEGRLISLLDEDVEYQVEVKTKLVDATLTMSNVPATTKPNYKVCPGVNLITINGLSDIRDPWPSYCVVGGGKTGIDAVLFLLDNGVDCAKICWVVPNDSWFFNRDGDELDSGNVSKVMTILLDAIIDEKADTREKTLLNLEKANVIMRLEENILPTRFRGATINETELAKLRQVKNILRKGRIQSIEEEKIIFQSGEEMNIDSKTLFVDCSTNSTIFPPSKKIFDGNTINVQWIMAPPPSMSANIIAAMELKYPKDEEKKNCLRVLQPPQMPEDFFKLFYIDNFNNSVASKEFGVMFQKKRRSFAMHHIKFFDLIKVMYVYLKRQEVFVKKLEALMEENKNEDKTEVSNIKIEDVDPAVSPMIGS